MTHTVTLDLDALAACLNDAHPDYRPEVVSVLRTAARDTSFTWRSVVLDNLADQIEAQTRPALVEPQNLGAVLVDSGGNTHVRTNDGDYPWSDDGGNHATWDDLYPGVEIVHEGWSE